MAYRVLWGNPSAEKHAFKLPAKVVDQLVGRVEALKQDPRPHGYRPVHGIPKGFRVRIGDYRLVYTIDDEQQLVTLIKIADRKDVYR